MGAKYSDDVNVRLDPMKPETAGFAYYNRAKDLLDDFLDIPRLSTVQAQILMLKFQEGIRRPGFFFRSWLYFGVIIRMAQDLGLNKNFDKWNVHISREDLICRKRVWQVCFLCDQFMSGAQGRDVVISLSNTDIELPHKDDYEEEQEFQVQTEFVHLVRLTKILASVMSVIAPVGAGTPLQAWSANPKLQILDNALDAWIQALPPNLRCQQQIEASPNSLPQTPSTHFAGFINILYHTVVILLHRPYITSLDNDKGSQPNSQHLSMCTLSANNISQIAQKMFEHWGPIVFQYPIRGGNYGVYCLVAASMIHLVNMSSPEIRTSRLAHDHLLRTLGVLKVCVEHSAAWDLRDKVHGLEAAFSAQQARQSVTMLFQGSNPNSPNHISPITGRPCRPLPKRSQSNNNTELRSSVETNQQQLLSNNISENFSHYSQNASPPHFHERPLYILTDDPQSSEQNSFTSEPEQLNHFDFMTTQHTLDENTLLTTQLGQIPISSSGINSVPTSGTFNPMISLNNSKQIDINGALSHNGTLTHNGTFWDANPLFVWNQISQVPGTTAQQMWSQNGGISPLSISTSPSANSPSGHQTPDHGSPASIEQQYSQSNAGSPVNSVVDPIIVASQNPEDINVWYNN
ncbi:fungal-specific transcription factor domain-containing protein [Glomus cerebriforme]|uniref:Fungal-specific transcription factor domain-containing protein n=1 Tax=Glomus cerebriforme TaxID=658196 RepID=A0A397T0Y4_9GLOM|nr:fungal-specific transcription factor domain-containing protein [Glomus cerebriforme]